MSKAASLIQETNDFSTVSKCSMVKNGYFKDDYIFHFSPHHTRRSPLINLGYYVRARVIDSTLKLFLQIIQGKAAQVISCGAGFDSNYFRLSAKGTLHAGIIYFEVDFLEVVRRKAECIKKSKPLLDVIGNIRDNPPVVLMGPSYRLVAADLCHLSELESALKTAEVNFDLPTLFLSECSITYMDEESSSRLIEWVSSKFKHASFLTYEQICPDDAFGLIMRNHFESLGSPLLSVTEYPHLHAQRERYFTRGWSSCLVLSAFDAFMQKTDSNELRRVLSLEPFDEFEEWHLKCCHYALILASNTRCITWPECSMFFSTHSSIPSKLNFHWVVKDVEGLRRFAHKSVRTNEDDIVVVGGFGHSATEKGHTRLSEVALISYKNCVSSVVNLETNNAHSSSLSCMHHTLTLLSNDLGDNTTTLLLYGGRSNPRKPLNVEPVLLTLENEVLKVHHVLYEGGDQLKKPAPRWRHSAVQMKTKQVAIFGGRNAELEVLGDLWFFVLSADLKSVSYQEIIAYSDVWPCPRFSHSAVMMGIDCQMAITGGIGRKDFLPLSDIWLFDEGSLKWQQIIMDGPGMLPRYGHTSAVFQERLILLGGVNTLSGQQPGVCVINMKLKSCMEYALPAQDIRNPILLHNHSSEQMNDGSELVLVGGGGNCFSFGTALNKCLVTIDLMQFV